MRDRRPEKIAGRREAVILRAFITLLLLPLSVGATTAQEFDNARIKLLLSPIESLASINRKREVETREVADALFEACNALENLSSEPQFGELLNFYQEHQYDPDLEPEISQLYQEFKLFLEFLEAERGILLKYLSEEAADDGLSFLLATRSQARNFKIDPNGIMRSLAQAKDKICIAAQQVEDRNTREEWRSLVGHSLLFLAGACVAVVNPIYLDGTPFGIVSGIGGLYLMALATDLL
jgi:hypothetical protein